MKNTALLLLLFSCFSCTTTAKSTTNMELNGFKEAIKHVHYLAKVKITNVEIIKEDDETDKHIYSAEVLATYRGKAQKKIRYEMFVEKGEDATFKPAPVYIALCIDNQNTYYWPGTGSLFTESDAINTWLIENKSKLDSLDANADWCE